MIFTTFSFLIGITVFLGLYFLIPYVLFRSILLALTGVLFYLHFSGTTGVSTIFILGILTYLSGKTKKPFLLIFVIALCVASLVFYKYTHFVFENLTLAIPLLGAFPVSTWAPVLSPLAISFFVFEFVHYLVDVKRGNKPIESAVDFLLFASFFPTLVAGPIKRYEQFLPSLKIGLSEAKLISSDTQIGLLRVVRGFGKKFIGDVLTAYIASNAATITGDALLDRWLLFSAIAFRIYFDFSGYSDMAIGFSRIMGIKIPENFNNPYLATNIRDFWHRWHISLSTWIRDYIYIPLGGGRTHPVINGINLLLVFLICGLWHGAAWNYVLWGLFQGVGLVIHRAYGSLKARAAMITKFEFDNKLIHLYASFLLNTAYLMGAWALTTFFVWTGWLLFFYPIDQAMKIFLSLFHV